jgi:hypothetical protein
MANFSGGHDAYRLVTGSDGTGLTQQLTVTSATGTSTTVFGTQTRAVQVVIGGTVSSNSYVFCKFYSTGKPTSQATSTTDAPVPVNWVQVFKCNPGERMSLIANDATTSYRAYISELTD